MMQFNNDNLRALAGIILTLLAVLFLILGAQNGTIEAIMIGLAGFLVGGAIFNRTFENGKD